MAKKIIPDAGNTQELERLTEEISRLENAKQKIEDKLEEQVKLNEVLKKELGETRTALKAATAKILVFEKGNNKSVNEDGIQDGFVEIVAVPPKKEFKPVSLTNRGIPVPMRVDEDGFHIFTVPKETAAKLCSETAGMKYYLLGPVKSIKAIVPDGLYSKEVIIRQRAKQKTKSGFIEFNEIIYEESK